MIRINENYTKLKASYLFADIARRVNTYVAANPSKPVIRLGIGDVTEPLPKVCLDALHAATDEMGQRSTFKGYGPEQGYAFLREAIAQHDYAVAAPVLGESPQVSVTALAGVLVALLAAVVAPAPRILARRELEMAS